MNWLDYREALKIGFCDEEKVRYFISKVINALKHIRDEATYYFGKEGYNNFCNTIGMVAIPPKSYFTEYDMAVEVLSKHTKSLEEFLAYFIAFANSFSENIFDRYNRVDLHNIVKKMLQESKIPYEIITDSDGVFIFPKGAEELDAALVSQPLSWLSAYPKANTAYVKALKEYSEATPDNASDIADKFRKTLETFLREFFGNSAPLEKNKVEYGRYLKSRGVPAEITGNMETLLQAYANFMNAYAKHQDATSLNVLEYLMYQTGNIIRLLITLKQAE